MSEAGDITTIDDEFADANSDPDLEVTISDMTSAIDQLLAPEFRNEAIAIAKATASIDFVLDVDFTEDQIQTQYRPIEEEFENHEDKNKAELFTIQVEKDKISEEDRRKRNLMAKKLPASYWEPS